jgi:hypothetical protein
MEKLNEISDVPKAIQILTKFINIIKDITKQDVEFAGSLSEFTEEIDDIAISTYQSIISYNHTPISTTHNIHFEDGDTKCCQCKSDLYDVGRGTLFCIKCGCLNLVLDDLKEKLKKPEFENDKTCPHCNSRVIKDSTYCWDCGMLLQRD